MKHTGVLNHVVVAIFDPDASTRGRSSFVPGAPMKYFPGAVCDFSLNPSNGKGFRPCRETGTESSIAMVEFRQFDTVSIEGVMSDAW